MRCACYLQGYKKGLKHAWADAIKAIQGNSPRRIRRKARAIKKGK